MAYAELRHRMENSMPKLSSSVGPTCHCVGGPALPGLAEGPPHARWTSTRPAVTRATRMDRDGSAEGGG